jgi:hypothetical protein
MTLNRKGTLDLLSDMLHYVVAGHTETAYQISQLLQASFGKQPGPKGWLAELRKVLAEADSKVCVESVFEEVSVTPGTYLQYDNLETIVTDLIRSGGLGAYRPVGDLWIVPAQNAEWEVEVYRRVVATSLIPQPTEVYLRSSEVPLRSLLAALGVSVEDVTEMVARYHAYGGYSNPPGEA